MSDDDRTYILCPHYMQAHLAEQEQKRLFNAQATKYAQHQAALAAAATSQAGMPSVDSAIPQAPTDSTLPLASRTEDSSMSHTAGGKDETSGRKRRRTVVDYVALNRQLEAETAEPAGQSGSQQTGGNASAPLSFVTNVAADAVGVHATSAVPNQKSDSLMDGTAFNVGQQVPIIQQPREGDKLS